MKGYNLTIDSDGRWCLAAEHEPLYRLTVEYSKSGRARCRKCSELIPSKTVRIGKPIKWSGFISSWTHISCFWQDDKGPAYKKEDIHGIEKLKQNEQKEVLQQVAKTKPPSSLKMITPDDPGFLKREPLKRVKQPENVQLQLLPFQEEGYGWMLSQEKNDYGGGILADEMGMGKTIQTVSLIASDKSSKKKKGGPTLIVCPASAMLQWQEEIRRCTKDNALKVLVFHGQSRTKLSPADILMHDVVLTTFPTLEYAYRFALNLTKVPCKYCGKKFIKRKLIAHNKYFCGPNSKRSARLAKTERSRAVATEKAMVTLKITKGDKSKELAREMPKGRSKVKPRRHNIPTPANIYRELMEDANRTPVSMYATKAEAGKIQEEKPDNQRTGLKQSEALAVKEIGLVERMLKSLWVYDNGKICFWRTKATIHSRWMCNLSDRRQANSVFEFTQAKADEVQNCEKDDIVLTSSGHTKFHLRLTEESAMVSLNNGENWEEICFSNNEKRQTCKGGWVCAAASEAKFDDDFTVRSPRIGQVVVRYFDKKPFLGVVIRATLGKDPLYKVVHWDGDMEDLSRSEVVVASYISKFRKFAGSGIEGSTSSWKSKRINGRTDSSFVLLQTLERLGAVADKKTHKETDKKVKESKFFNKKSTKSKEDSDSDYVDEGNQTSESESGDSDFVSFDTKKSKKAVNGGTKQSKDAANEVDVEDDVIPDPNFVPATWGRDDMLFEKLRQSNYSPSRKRKRKKKKKPNRKGKTKKGKVTKSSAKVTKKTPGKPKRKSQRKTSKKTALDFSSSESDDDSVYSSSSEDEIVASSKSKEPFMYAPRGDVVDDDGIDLGTSLLHCIAWKRVVLDEAHKIKDRVNSTAKSTYSLRGDPRLKGAGTGSGGGLCHRWCLTGTPMQNRIGELYSLVRFLRIDPYAFYYCSVPECTCRSLHWNFGSMSRHCQHCGHAPMRHYSYFNKSVMNPIKRIGYTGDGRKAMLLLRDDLLGKIMLRRTKEEKQKDIKLPPLNVKVVKLDMSVEEKDFYESVYKNTRAKFDTYVKKGTLLHNYAHIFELLSRLRRSADHPYMVIHSKSNTNDTQENFSFPSKSAGQNDVCGICQYDIESLKECAISHCRHTFHRTCVTDLINEFKENTKATAGNGKKGKGKKVTKAVLAPDCPVCFQPLSVTLGLHGGIESSKDLTESPGVEEESNLCVICFDNKRDALFMPCGHLYTCMSCFKSLNHRSCPMCRTPIQKTIKASNGTLSNGDTTDNSTSMNGKRNSKSVALVGRSSILQRIKVENFASSSKIDGVVKEVQKMLKLPLRKGEPPHKAIIFSQYTDMIDLVDWKLRTSGIKAVRLVGSMPVKERQSVLAAFRNPNASPPVPVILMSLKAGGEGLNLQEATHVMILETWWNPQVHNQAYQRAHRIGQKRPVTAMLFVTRDTIEERMHELQEKKQLIFDGAIDGSAKALQQLTEEDLRFLFAR